MPTRQTLMTILAFAVASAASAREYHVSINGDDANDGSAGKSFKTISAAAKLAQSGDTVTVHAGTYRERVAPPRGGESDVNRITYRAAPGEKVVITGSEPIQGWEKVSGDTWKVTIPNSFFGDYNPYSTLIKGDWFSPEGRQHHTGSVYLNGDWRWEAAKLDDVLKPAGKTALWFGQVDDKETTIWSQFKGVNPNEQQVEINVRPTVFTPTKTGINYLTIRGFDLRNAATNWAPPTAGQIGLVSAYWCKGWIIENNEISHSRCSGIALGKYADEWDNRAGSAEGYVGTIKRGLANGWNRETIGHHIVRNNHIHHCEQTGIVGSLGCAFSTITGNEIHDIHLQRLFSGAEMAGIKFHGAIDVQLTGNHIYRVGGLAGIWLDWMTQGTKVTGNLLHNNDNAYGGDLFCEVNHGPFLVANNIMLSNKAHLISSQGGAYAHNLIGGKIQFQSAFDSRMTPFHKAHSTEIAGLHNNPNGDVRYYNNLFTARGDNSTYNKPMLPVWMAGNVFLKGAVPCTQEKTPLLKPDFDAGVKLTEKADGWYLELAVDSNWAAEQNRRLVTTELLGKAKISGMAFENPDGSPLKIDTDYFGNKRNASNPFPGPFAMPEGGKLRLKVWPVGTQK